MTIHAPARGSFLAKVIAAAALIAFAELLFFEEEPGGTIGMFALAWVAAAVAASPALRRQRAALLAAASAAGFALLLIDDPNPLALVLFWIALSSAVLLPRHRFRHAGGWALQLMVHGFKGLIAPLRDVRRLGRLRSGPLVRIVSATALLGVPVIGGALFLALFAGANPVIANALARIEMPSLGSAIAHAAFWTAVLIAVWPSFRPRGLTGGGRGLPLDPAVPDLPLASLILSLIVFNLIFAAENVLDIAFLWSGAALPAGVTLADYAHRGAYTLIATALLAGAFVLAALRPGGPGARSRWARRLVVAWVAQNLLLVASSVRRTLDYVDAYQMTVLRLSALAWMVLVACGLVLICRRLLAGRSTAWLINANALATGLVLMLAAIVDLGSAAARWNVAAARNGKLDLCYLARLGPSALLPLVELEQRAGPELRARVVPIRARAMEQMEAAQADWHQWTWRGARRLAAARRALGPTPTRPDATARHCDGSPATTPTVPPAPAPAPLTVRRQG